MSCVKYGHYFVGTAAENFQQCTQCGVNRQFINGEWIIGEKPKRKKKKDSRTVEQLWLEGEK